MSLARRCCGPPDWARSGEAVGPLSIRRCPAAAVVLAGGHVLDDGELELGTATPDALAPLLRLQLQRPRDQLDAQRAVLEHESAQVLIAAQEDKAGEIAEVELRLLDARRERRPDVDPPQLFGERRDRPVADVGRGPDARVE
jgi:hypothetical protein